MTEPRPTGQHDPNDARRRLQTTAVVVSAIATLIGQVALPLIHVRWPLWPWG